MEQPNLLIACLDGGATVQADDGGLYIHIDDDHELFLDGAMALALCDFLRRAGVRPLLNKAWRQQQAAFAAEVNADFDAEQADAQAADGVCETCKLAA
jgi:hypothetical protein